MHTTTFFTAALMASARLIDANSLKLSTEVKRNLERGILDLANCESDSDCPGDWTCNGESASGKSCALYKIDKRSTGDIARRGLLDLANCNSDSDCPGEWTCNGDSDSGNSCALYKIDKRGNSNTIERGLLGLAHCQSDSDCPGEWECNGDGGSCALWNIERRGDSFVEKRAHGNCDTTSDCQEEFGNSWYCDEVYEGGSRVEPIKVCLPGSDSSSKKRGMERREHGNCDESSDCKKYGNSWTCDEVWEGAWGSGAVNVCLP